MNTQTINLTPTIDGVQYGISDEKQSKDDFIIHTTLLDKVIQCPDEYGSTKEHWSKIICSTNPKDTRFPYLVMPSKEQEDEQILDSCEEEVNKLVKQVYKGKEGNPRDTNDRIGVEKKFRDACNAGVLIGFNANPAKYTQEQMEKAIEFGFNKCKEYGDITKPEREDFYQSLQPTAKAVRVEMEENCLGSTPTWECNCVCGFCENIDGYKIKLETSSEHSQGLVKALEVIY